MADQVQYCICCRFWHLQGRDMLCRRRAPTRDLMCRPTWPQTLPLMVCGEFEPVDRPEIDRRKSLLRPPKQVQSQSIDDIEITL
jgi:hypothetical protein